MPDFIAVAVGAFADTQFPLPGELFTRSAVTLGQPCKT